MGQFEKQYDVLAQMVSSMSNTTSGPWYERSRVLISVMCSGCERRWKVSQRDSLLKMSGRVRTLAGYWNWSGVSKKSFDGTRAKYIAYNDAFHQMIVRLSQNDHLIEMCDRLHIRVYRVQAESLNSSAAFKRSRSEHKAIVAALVKADGEKAERLMRRHIRHRLPEILADSSDFFA